MAVKVMLASPQPRREAQAEEKSHASPVRRTKRRRSSVYDAHGNEVFITLICLKCHKIRPLAQFGLRKMTDGAIRNQPWCRSCRSSVSESTRRAKEAALEEALARNPTVPEESPESAPSLPGKVADSGSVAAAVAAAQHGGRR